MQAKNKDTSDNRIATKENNNAHAIMHLVCVVFGSLSIVQLMLFDQGKLVVIFIPADY